jgi:hypothetical protein
MYVCVCVGVGGGAAYPIPFSSIPPIHFFVQPLPLSFDITPLYYSLQNLLALTGTVLTRSVTFRSSIEEFSNWAQKTTGVVPESSSTTSAHLSTKLTTAPACGAYEYYSQA